MSPKLLPGLSKIAKAFSLKSRRRNRNDSVQVTPSIEEKQMCNGKLQATRGSSSTTCCSSGYFREPQNDPVCAIDAPPLALTSCITQKADKVEVEDVSLTSVTLYSSDDTGSCPSSPLPMPRPPTIRQMHVSHNDIRQQSQATSTSQEDHIQQTMVLHHSKSASFRLRKRNRALSDKDFEQLLTLSRGWTFDPALARPLVKPRHNRHAAMSSTDFDRYIFAPTPARQVGERIRSASAVCLAEPPRPAAAKIKSKSLVAGDASVHPFFQAPQHEENDRVHF
jgi:hypothetical protein